MREGWGKGRILPVPGWKAAAWAPLGASPGPTHLCHQCVYPPWISTTALPSPFSLYNIPWPQFSPGTELLGSHILALDHATAAMGKATHRAIPPTTGRILAPPARPSSLWAHPWPAEHPPPPEPLKRGHQMGTCPGQGGWSPPTLRAEPDGPAWGSWDTPSSGFPHCLECEGAALGAAGWPRLWAVGPGPCPGPSRTCI